MNIKHTATKYIMINKQQYVDLGLPSGNLWAVKDIGAIDINHSGDQYQWGNNINLNVADESELEHYKSQILHYKAPKTFDYDIVNDKMGGGWQVPTAVDYQELIDNCKVAFYENLNYITFTGKTGQSLRFNAYKFLKLFRSWVVQNCRLVMQMACQYIVLVVGTGHRIYITTHLQYLHL